jgi:hypothetical protein
MRRHVAAAVVLLELIPGISLAEIGLDGGATDTLARTVVAQLQIITDVDSAFVSLDGRMVGRTPLVADSLSAGIHGVQIIHPDEANWLTPAITDTIRLLPGQKRILRYTLTSGIIVRSDPDGASVFMRDSLLGVTPLSLLPGRWSRSTLLQVKKPGYEAVFVDPSLSNRGVLTVPLHGQPGGPGGGDNTALIEAGEGGPRALRLYISGGVAVAAGVASAYLKIAADERQEAYSLTGDPSILSERRRFDTAAGITFAVTQIALGLFSYYLLSE